MGHCGVVLNTADGWVVDAGDAYFDPREVHQPRRECARGVALFQTVVTTDRRLRFHNQDRLRDLVATHPEIEVFAAHDPSGIHGPSWRHRARTGRRQPARWGPASGRCRGRSGWARGRAAGRPGRRRPRYDPELLEHGDTRNVVDAYRYWRREAVAADLAARAHPFHVAIENFGHDHNIGTVVRTANAFAAAGVHIVGRRRWNRRGAMVTDRYLQAAPPRRRGRPGRRSRPVHELTVVAVDNTPGAQPLETRGAAARVPAAVRPGGTRRDRRRPARRPT